jgi:hypothetical protein
VALSPSAIKAYTFTNALAQVSIVWTLAGSTVSLFVGFVIPTSCYLIFCYRKQLAWERSQVCSLWAVSLGPTLAPTLTLALVFALTLLL